MQKVRITKTPKDGSKFINPNETNLQHFTNNPLPLVKQKSKEILETEGVGNNYPIEKSGKGNAEAEKGETIFKLENSRLFKIGGETHKKGGTDIIMNPGDFIFSNSLKIKGDIMKSEFGMNPEKEHTFADVSKKYLNMNGYHKLADDIDPLEKNTANKMIKAYKDKLSKIAFLQEAQKGFPTGIPEIVTPLMEKVASVPEGSVPKDSIMKDGGQWIQKAHLEKGRCTPGSPNYDCPKGSPQWNLAQTFKKHHGFHEDGGECDTCGGNKKYDNGGVFKDYEDKKSKTPYKVPEKFRNYTKEQADKEFYTPEVLAFMKQRDKEEGIDSDKGNAQDYTWGKRHEEAYKNFFADKPVTTPSPTVTPEEITSDINTNISPNESFKPSTSGYRDMGFSSPEMMALALASRPIPYIAPTRVLNENYASAIGAMSNVMPYNYQSVINEATRGGYNAIKANTNLTGNVGQAFANNAFIAGQLGEQTSKIKGEEYNQNANLYNQNNQMLGQTLIQQGQDVEMQSGLYNDKVAQGRENLFANKMAQQSRFATEFANAMNNRSLRNAYGYLGQSTNPNFQAMNANMAIGFNPAINPFDFNAKQSSTPYQQFQTETKGMDSEQIKSYVEWLKAKNNSK